MSASNYERELKSILMGDKKILDLITKTCSEEEKSNYFRILEKPFVVVRAAGSYGIDLVAVKSDISMLIEIKSSKGKKIHFSSKSGKLQEQADKMKEYSERAGVLPIYAFRLKNCRGDAWRIFTIDIEGLEGFAKYIHGVLPKIRSSREKNLVMNWDEGMPLSEFIKILADGVK